MMKDLQTGGARLPQVVPPEVLEQVVNDHQLWIDTDGQRGRRAIMSGWYLSRAHLAQANLNGADLRKVNLSNANLHGARLICSDLREANRSAEHTYELQSLMRISYAVFGLNKKHITHYTFND